MTGSTRSCSPGWLSLQSNLVRQEVRYPDKHFPASGRAREPAVETAVEHQVVPRVVVQHPQIAHGLAAEKGLGEVPYFPGRAELLPQGMGHRQRLPELRTANPGFVDFVEKIIGVVVKTSYVRADQEQDGVAGTPNVKVGRVSAVMRL